MSDVLEREIRRQTEVVFGRLRPIEDLLPEDMAETFGVERAPAGTTTLTPPSSRRRVSGWVVAAATAAVVLAAALPAALQWGDAHEPSGAMPASPGAVTSSSSESLRDGMVQDPGSGHTYEAVTSRGSLDWTDARADAEARSFRGVSGHLVTITSRQEDEFIQEAFSQTLRSGPWLGGFQPEGSPEPAGDWQWVTGEPFDYDNWGDGEPNDDGGEDCIQYLPGPPVWNDFPCGAGPGSVYIVEYDTPID